MSDLEQAKALFQRALAAHGSEHYPEAARLLRQALQIAPDRVSVLTNLAAVQLKLDCPEDALVHAKRAIELHPESAEAWLNAGSALLQLNRHDEALAHLDRTLELKPGYGEAWSNRGNVLNELMRHEEALDSYDRALELNAELADAWTNRGKALNALGRRDEALASHDRALALRPGLAEAWTTRGNVLMALKRLDEALASHDRAVALRPGYAEAWSNRGDVLNELKRHDEALASCDRAIQLDPGLAAAWTNRGNVLTELARYDDAIANHDRAIALRLDFAAAWSNRGITLQCLRKHAEAMASFERAKAIAPNYALAHFNEGVSRLSIGDFERGWEAYEWRWRTGKGASRPQINAPVWSGESVPGALMACCEQGLGDQILHMSMLEEARRFARDMIVVIEPRLVALAQRSFPDIRVVSSEEPLPTGSVAAWIPMGTLGKLLRKSWKDFAGAKMPFLRADRVRSADLRARLTLRHKTVCGVSWLSKNAHFGNQKSIRLQDLLGILRIPGIEFVDLQYGDTREERQELLSRHGLSVTRLDEIDNTRDMDGLAALIGACDMVVTISNTTAHLAGALGSRPYVMLPYSHGRFWYWHEDREDSPWYPGATLVRQPRPNDWVPVLDRIARAIRRQMKSTE